ncbi:MAG TPA: 1-acyl-sn-glycerol-3-phosphate acyltransferase [Candidatus Faecousia intestinigallinarum]|nr:1-acyl-sn-glycerol-3-phosphate acyltransferase [Candidatus Faecousia intestinigallinarum]
MSIMLLKAIGVAAGILAFMICGISDAFATLDWLWVLPAGFLGCAAALVAAAFLILCFFCALVDMDKPRDRDHKFYRWLTYRYVEAIFTLLRMRVHTRGMEMLPQEGRFLLVCNHLNDMDPVTLLGCFQKSQLAFISKRENDQKFLVGKLMHQLLCQPINRENNREALRTILRCIEIIQKDMASIAVFPEGYTSRDGKLHSFRHGVFKIAQKAQVPIVVCTLQNTQYIFRNAKRLKPTDVYLHLLAVIPPEELKGVTATQIGERVHAMMAEDLGE